MEDVKVVEKLDDRGKSQLTISSPKRNADYIVYKTEDGFPHYGVKLTKGDTPKVLSGKYTKLELAKKAVLFYLSHAKDSATVKRDKNTAAREQRKAY